MVGVGARGVGPGGEGQQLSDQHEALVSRLKQQLLQLNPVVQQQAGNPNSPFCCPLQCSTKGIPCIASPTTLSCVLSPPSPLSPQLVVHPRDPRAVPSVPTPPALTPLPSPIAPTSLHQPLLQFLPQPLLLRTVPQHPLCTFLLWRPLRRGQLTWPQAGRLHLAGVPVARKAELDLELHL